MTFTHFISTALVFVAASAWATGSVTGTITLAGAPKAEKVPMEADPKCLSLNDGKPVLRDDVVVGKDGGLRDVVIYVKQGLPAKLPASAETPAALVLDQKGCMFHPKVVALQVNQPLRIKNADPTAHNTRSLSKSNGSFNVNAPRVMELPKPIVFTKPELGVKIKCDIHRWMLSYVHVFDHPYFAVSDDSGNFRIQGLPPGEYVLEARHESPKVGVKTAKITVKEGAETKVGFPFSLANP